MDSASWLGWPSDGFGLSSCCTCRCQRGHVPCPRWDLGWAAAPRHYEWRICSGHFIVVLISHIWCWWLLCLTQRNWIENSKYLDQSIVWWHRWWAWVRSSHVEACWRIFYTYSWIWPLSLFWSQAQSLALWKSQRLACRCICSRMLAGSKLLIWKVASCGICQVAEDSSAQRRSSTPGGKSGRSIWQCSPERSHPWRPWCLNLSGWVWPRPRPNWLWHLWPGVRKLMAH